MWPLNPDILNFGYFCVGFVIFMRLATLRSSFDRTRIVSQIVMIFVMYAILAAPLAVTVAFCGLATLQILREVFAIFDAREQVLGRTRSLKIFTGMLLPFFALAYVLDMRYALSLAIAYLLGLTLIVLAEPDVSRAVGKVFAALLLLFVAASLGLLGFLRGTEQGDRYVLYVFFLTNTCDAFAFLGGKILGRNRFLKHISPNKTVEGYLAAAIAGALFSWIYSSILHLPLPLWAMLLLGIIWGVFTQVGDLFASLFKRFLGIKDYGTLIPGHGGVLDRLDSLLITLPLSLLVHILFFQ
ncbi:phosphatidate cytidylyltransferase [Oligoflexus tunisiensis]|uniref:phosphatidate cytidylyltransferase n=1 Tax=Oligoflexus tunisiensis TaxID=708132 RepID=UPI000A3E81B8|nr:phosphatidate cytidylyltransferase [Oligoflexus tunisiensis]